MNMSHDFGSPPWRLMYNISAVLSVLINMWHPGAGLSSLSVSMMAFISSRLMWRLNSGRDHVPEKVCDSEYPPNQSLKHLDL